MHEYLVLPGYEGSGPTHWQTLWEADSPLRRTDSPLRRTDSSPLETPTPGFRRVHQRDWSQPECSEWSAVLDREVEKSQGNVILVAHSLACLLVAHWASAAAERTRSKVSAAFLVAPVNPESPAFPKQALGFTPIPLSPMPFKSLIIASTNDPYGSVEFALHCSHAWQSLFEVVGPKGHINGNSGLGAWPEGRALLAGLAGS